MESAPMVFFLQDGQMGYWLQKDLRLKLQYAKRQSVAGCLQCRWWQFTLCL